MKSVAFVLLLAGCTDAAPFPAVITSSNGPVAGQSHEAPATRPDAGSEGGGDGGLGDGGGFDALPTAFDAGTPFDVGSPATDAGVP